MSECPYKYSQPAFKIIWKIFNRALSEVPIQTSDAIYEALDKASEAFNKDLTQL